MEPWRGDTPSYDSGAWRRVLEESDLFAPGGESHVAWEQPTDPGAWSDRVASVSFIAALTGVDRTRVLDQVRAVAAATPAPLALRYVADVYLFTGTT